MIIPLEPKLEGLAEKRFFGIARQILQCQKAREPQRISILVDDEAHRAAGNAELNGQVDRYVACIRILGDLAQLRWTLEETDYGLELRSPKAHDERVRTPEEARARKDAIRAELRPRVHQQFEDKSVRAFIRQMESPSAAARQRTVKSLIADGMELRDRLTEAHAAPSGSEARTVALRQAVRPYLQLVEPGVRDVFTGILLQDVWRYVRYTWSIPQTAIPGRKLHYLVRDAAQSQHAVMGIAALNNCAVQMAQRDQQIGWSTLGVELALKALFHPPKLRDEREHLLRQMNFQGVYRALRALLPDTGDVTEPDRTRVLERLRSWLLDGISGALGDIEWTGLATEAEIRAPTESLVSRLRRLSGEFANHRQTALAGGDFEGDMLDSSEWDAAPVAEELLQLEAKHASNKPIHDSRRMLVRKKRAAELSRLLEAELIIKDSAEQLGRADTVFATLEQESVRAAVNTALNAIKSKRIGTGLLEITTCGAVAPYTHLLGGKLVALLLLSPQVATDYRARYGSEPTIIRSQLKNAPVIPDNTLVWLGTTSLFSHGSSQYERLRLPHGVFAPDQEEIRYRRLGVTSGYGTVQFADETVRSVEAVMRRERGYRDVNSVFGEGASPKLRKLRAGLDALGFNSELLLMHHQERLIYGVPLFSGAASYLCGMTKTKPSFVVHPEHFADAPQQIAEHWRTRWLAGRLDHAVTWDALAEADAWTLGAILPNLAPSTPETVGAPPVGPAVSPADLENNADELAFWRRLAQAGPNAIAEGLTDADFDRLHLESPLEAKLLSEARRGVSLVLTGNAGDGKTHAAKVLQRTLGAEAVRFDFAFDATAIMSREAGVEPVVERWRQARQGGKGIVLAVNQYPLYLLRASLRRALPDISSEVETQWANRLVYDDEAEGDAPSVRVVDLSLRNPLAPDFAGAAIARMLSRPAIQRLAASNVDPNFSFNYRHLSDVEVRRRLLALFGRVISAGGRATVRELWILCARLLFGSTDQPDTAGAERTRYSERLFEDDARFPLSGWLRRCADPADVTHPQLDRRLESANGTRAAEWRVEQQLPDTAPGRLIMAGLGDPGRDRYRLRFTATKRLFYFEHTDGGEAVFSLDDSAHAQFHNLLQDSRSDRLHLQNLVAAINRAYFPADFEGARDKLCLWIGHRLDEQPTSSYVANEAIPARLLGLWRPRPTVELKDALNYIPDHILLGLREAAGRVAVETALRIDAQLYATLMAIRQGLPRHLINPGELNRLDAFIDRLRGASPDVGFEFLTYNAEHVLPAVIQMSPTFDRYLAVRRLDR